MSISKLMWASATQAEAYQVVYEASNISLKTLTGWPVQTQVPCLGPDAIKKPEGLGLERGGLVVFREALPLTFENVQPFWAG